MRIRVTDAYCSGKGKQSQQQDKGKKKEAAADADDEDAASDQAAEDTNAAETPKEQKKKDKGKQQQGKKDGGKDAKDGGKDAEKIEAPPLFPPTPFYGHPYPGLANYPPVLEQPGWNLEQSLATARRADEEYIGRWLTEKGAPFHLGAMNWLDEREKQRRAQIAHPFPAAADKQVKFAEPGEASRPGFLPLYGCASRYIDNVITRC